ncbi:Nuclear envelope morphology protein 1 [Podila humilis]|nr:Nuclear envelope morphology protein 1 [Podila humilis]
MTYLFLFHLFVVLPASALTKVSRRARLVLGIESKSSSNSHNSSTVTSQQNSSGVDTDFEEPSSSSSFSTSFSTPSTSLSLRGFFRSKKAVLDSRNNNNNGMDGVGEKFLKQYTQDNHLGSTTTTTTATTTYSYGHRNSGLNGGNVGGQDGNNSMLRRSSRFKSKSDLDEFAQSSVMAASAAVATAPGATGGGISVNNTIATARRPTPSQAISHGYGTDSMAEDGSGDNSATPRSSMASVRLRQRMGRPSSGLGSPGSSGMTAGSGSRKKTLVLDLDETLIHSTSRGSRSQGYMVEVLVDRHACLYYVYKRPHVDYFLKKVAEWYKLVIFTASMAEYADPVIDWLDQSRTLFDKRYFRQACYFKNGSYLKDLTVIEPDLSSVCLLDNSPISYSLNKENGIPIDSWINDPNDEALLDLLPFLDALRFTEDSGESEDEASENESDFWNAHVDDHDHDHDHGSDPDPDPVHVGHGGHNLDPTGHNHANGHCLH